MGDRGGVGGGGGGRGLYAGDRKEREAAEHPSRGVAQVEQPAHSEMISVLPAPSLLLHLFPTSQQAEPQQFQRVDRRVSFVSCGVSCDVSCDVSCFVSHRSKERSRDMPKVLSALVSQQRASRPDSTDEGSPLLRCAAGAHLAMSPSLRGPPASKPCAMDEEVIRHALPCPLALYYAGCRLVF